MVQWIRLGKDTHRILWVANNDSDSETHIDFVLMRPSRMAYHNKGGQGIKYDVS
jgi:hypothetical protein